MATAIKKPKYVTMPGASPAGTDSGTVPHRPHRPERPEIVYLVREPPTVFPYDDAVIHYNIKGDHHEGIYKGGVFSGFGVTYPETGKIRIAPGYGSIWGRQFELESAHDIDMSALTGVKYCVVYVEVNLKSATNQKAEIKMVYAGAGYPDIDTNDLIIQKQGVARMYLYSFEYEANGHLFSNVQQKFYQFGEGVAERARSMGADGIWNGRKVSDLFYYNADRFKKGNHAQYADLSKSIGTNGNWLAHDDQLQIESSEDDTDIRSLLCVTKGAFIVDPPVANLKEVGNIPLIRENTSQKFYYSNGGNPIPEGAVVVGVLVTGACKIYGWANWDIFHWFLGWRLINGDNFSFNRPWYNPTDGSWSLKEAGAMLGGHLWESGQELKIVSYPNGTGDGVYAQMKGFVGIIDPVEVPVMGNYYYAPNWQWYNNGIRDNYIVGSISFKDIKTKKPYVQVSMVDNAAFSGYLEFRLLYIKGEDSKGKEQTKYPWASLNPSLEGGQQ